LALLSWGSKKLQGAMTSPREVSVLYCKKIKGKLLPFPLLEANLFLKPLRLILYKPNQCKHLLYHCHISEYQSHGFVLSPIPVLGLVDDSHCRGISDKSLIPWEDPQSTKHDAQGVDG